MRRALLVALGLVLLAARPALAEDDELPLPTRVNQAIDRGAANLVKRQCEDGAWRRYPEGDKCHPLGRTALSTFALLHAGLGKDDEPIRKALDWLQISERYGMKRPVTSVYDAGCLALMLNALGDKHGPSIRKICEWLVEKFDPTPGMWGYPDGTRDLSNTQFAALALKVGEQHGYKAPPAVWKRLIDTVLRLQSETGGIRYYDGAVYSATMTHAGLLVWRFAHEALGRRPARRVKEGIKKATRWLEENFDVERRPTGRGHSADYYYYYMYGLERYAVIFGLKKIGGHDWYKEGAEALLARQKKDGSWGELEHTAFAILFLRRATLTVPDARDVGEVGEAEGEEKKDEKPRPLSGVPYLMRWLVAGPFQGTKHEDDHLFLKHLDPKRVTPREGVTAGKLKWKAYVTLKPKIDFKESVGDAPWASYYAAVYLHADAAKEGVLWLASDDGLRAYLNGKEILYGHHHGYSGDDFYRVPVKLKEGKNLLLLHVENLRYYVYFKARLSNPEGGILRGVVDALTTRPPRRR